MAAQRTRTPKVDDKHEEAMRRFDSVSVPQQPLRSISRMARRFVTIPGAQWEDSWAENWSESAPRPEIDKITKSLEKILSDYRENRLQTSFIPGDDDADDSSAQLLEGLYLADFHAHKASQARDTAFQEGTQGGFGAWLLATCYDDEYDPDNDHQRVNPGKVIVEADQCVFFDPASVLYDASDAMWAFLRTAWPRADAEAKWGSFPDWPMARGLDWTWKSDWYRPDVVYTADYYEIEETDDTVLIFTQQQSEAEQRFFKSEIPDGVSAELKAQGWKRRERPIKRRRVHWYTMSGDRILDDHGYIVGPNIPIVPFYGRRDWVDNMPFWRGHVLKRMDDQRNLNTQIGRLIEIAGLSPFETPIFDPRQITGTMGEDWARANIDRLPYLLANSLDDENGHPVAMGPIGKVTPPSVPEVTAAILQFALASLTDQDDNADQVKANTSADAMDIAAARVDAKSSIYLDNYRQSEERSGEIYLGMAREVYFEPGRKVDTLTMDGTQGTAELMEPAFDQGVYKTRNDLTQGRFKVIASVQEATATKRQRAVRIGMELASAFGAAQSPQDALAMLYEAGMNVDGINDDLKAYLRQKSIAVGSTKPTEEEAQELAQAQQGKQPAPADQALAATAAKDASAGRLNDARVLDVEASAALKQAQKEVLEKAPAVPTGLSNAPSPANDAADAVAKIAGAKLHSAQADHLQSEIHRKRIATGADLAAQAHQQHMDRAGHELAVRQQDHAEAQPTGEAA